MFYKQYKQEIEELHENLKEIDKMLKELEERRRQYNATRESISDLWEHLLKRTQIDVGLDKSACIVEVVEALLEHLNVDITEVERHLEIRSKPGPGVPEEWV